MKLGSATALGLFAANCASLPGIAPNTHRPITEESYRAAARHCHSKDLIRMRSGVTNTFYVGGIVDPTTGKASGDRDAARIECVRNYLGIPKKDVVILYS